MKRMHKKMLLEDDENFEGGGAVYLEFGTDLTQLAESGEMDPVIGRNDELEQVIWILSRKTKNNPVLIGEPGVGKTAAVEKLAQVMVGPECPEFLTGKKLISIDLTKVIKAGALNQLIQEVKEYDLILFMDELHTLKHPENAYFDALKPALARGLLSLIGATTLNEFRESIEKDGAMERRFQKVYVDEPSYSECLEILNGVKEKYEGFHNVTYTDAALEAFIKLSQKYVTDRFLPDKAIDFMDETGAKIRMARTKNPQVAAIEKEILDQIENVNTLTKNQDFDGAYLAHAEVKRLQDELKGMSNKGETIEITKEMTEEVVAKKTRIPIEKVSVGQKANLKGMQARLHTQIIGQDDAVAKVANVIKRTKAGLKDPNRPEGVFLFLGPTGVGKTELVKSLALELFGSKDKMFRLDMSEFSEPHTVSKLFGSPPGYVGYGEGTQFTEKVRRNPHCIILLDELEKAHLKVIQAWLQVFEDGHMTDGQGRKVDFKNTIIIMTSNIGAKAEEDKKSLGFSSQSNASQETRRIDLVMEELKKKLPPEFLNRIDEIVIFKALDKDALFKIVELELQKVANKLKERDIVLTWGDSVKELIIKNGYDPEMGARPLRRAVQKYVEDPIANAIIEDEVEDKIRLDYDLVNGKLIINGKPVNESKANRIQRVFHLFESESESKDFTDRKILTFESFGYAQPAPAPSPKPQPKPQTPTRREPARPPGTEPQRPVKPEAPTKPDPDRIRRPSKDPRPIAKKKKATEFDVVQRYIDALKRK
jgi:ATP-dependent Clp protease ATP-binding subunit ClpC